MNAASGFGGLTVEGEAPVEAQGADRREVADAYAGGGADRYGADLREIVGQRTDVEESRELESPDNAEPQLLVDDPSDASAGGLPQGIGGAEAVLGVAAHRVRAAHEQKLIGGDAHARADGLDVIEATR